MQERMNVKTFLAGSGLAIWPSEDKKCGSALSAGSTCQQSAVQILHSTQVEMCGRKSATMKIPLLENY